MSNEERSHLDADSDGSSSELSSQDQALDVLLAKARWPEPADWSRRELLATWENNWNAGARRSRRIVWATGAIAAMLAIAFGIGQLGRKRGMKHEAPIVRNDGVKLLPRTVAVERVEMGVPSREADALATLRDAPSPPDVAMLVARFDDARIDCRFAAARALGTLCGEHVRAELEEMVISNSHRREALAALLCCEDSRASEFLAAAARADRSMDAQIRAVEGEIKRLF